MRFDKEVEEQLKSSYPTGTRVRCINMPDDPHPIPAGTLGTVQNTNGFGQVSVHWDNGSTLRLLDGIDEFEIVKEVG